ncbi:melanoma-associated antigen B5-like [Microcebus murinus]|uniref:melanoma-associated antigen B5-like n=1 Tax=Microcebus murinus TaxID=30608 RepID=UPI000642BE61|nr:melanoma-associated antigen B5-like [Microcebus murinus]
MPRGQKSKLHAREKRQQARCENKAREGAQAKAAAAEEEPPPEESPPSSSVSEGVTKSLPVAESCSTSQEPQEAPPTTTTSEVISCTRSEEDSNIQDEAKESNAEASPSRNKVCRDPIARKTKVLEQFLLYKCKMKQPIMKADMLKIVNQKYKDQFPEIFKRVCEHLEMVFAVDVKEVDSTRELYDLVSKLKLPNNGRVRGGRGLPKTGLLMNILGMIFMKGNCATEEDIWKYLSMMRVYAGRKHFVYGEPRKLITKDLVRLKYLEYRQIRNSDPARYEFLWGPKAHAETTKMKVLEFLAKINGTAPSAYPNLYEEALKDEETRAQAVRVAKPAPTFKVCALCSAMRTVYLADPIDV